MRKKVIWIAVGVLAAAGAAVWWMVQRYEPAGGHSLPDKPPSRWGGKVRLAGGGFAAYGWSVEPGTKATVERATGPLRSAPTEPDITFVFYSAPHSPEAIAVALRESGAAGRRVCGWSSERGVIAPDGYHASPDGVIGLLSLRLPGVVAGVGEAGFDEADSPAGCARLALRRAGEDAGTPGELPSLVVMCSTYHGHEEAILKALDEELAGAVPVMGGTAAGSPGPSGPTGAIIANGGVTRKGLVLCALYSREPFRWAFQGGFTRTSKSGVITATDGRTIYEINGRPALDVYDQWSGGRVGEAMRAGKDMSAFTGLYPLCRTVTSKTTAHNLFIHAWPPEDAATTRRLVTSATLEPGSLVYFSEGSWNILLNRIGTLAHAARNDAPQESLGAGLFICCEAVLKNIPPEQRDQMAHLLNNALGDAPWMGPFTWGEQGNFPGVGNYHGNVLTSLTLFPASGGRGE